MRVSVTWAEYAQGRAVHSTVPCRHVVNASGEGWMQGEMDFTGKVAHTHVHTHTQTQTQVLALQQSTCQQSRSTLLVAAQLPTYHAAKLVLCANRVTTGCEMILVLKLISVAVAYQDGRTKKKEVSDTCLAQATL